MVSTVSCYIVSCYCKKFIYNFISLVKNSKKLKFLFFLFLLNYNLIMMFLCVR